MNLHKTRSAETDAIRVVLRGDGSILPELKITFIDETISRYVDADDLITMGKALKKWGEKLKAHTEGG